MSVTKVKLCGKNGNKAVGHPLKVNLDDFIVSQVKAGLTPAKAMELKAKLKDGHSVKYMGATGKTFEGITHVLIQPLYSPFEGN
ncbi:hypothetical protein [Endozoicomonas sp. SESOKO1]|uniref:hypothetical protein n=1 Tax=Endozoicomonas sp. SESOKO1 TaxID=2828742 RepID=UPI002148B504|nr:hypothetical protein [Endozoicomonas sp. SESOKO1]